MTSTRKPEDSPVTDVRVARWDALQPADGQWSNLVGNSEEREEFIARLRQLVEFLESRPEIPVPPLYASISFNVFAEGTDAEKLAQVDYASTLLEAPVIDQMAEGGHYRTRVGFGNLEYQFIAIPSEPVERPAASFAVGQEVRLAPEVARAFRRSGIAQAGTILSCDPGGSGPVQYLVRFPGRIKMHLPGTMLQPAAVTAVTTSRGRVTSLLDAEARLIDVMARIGARESRGEPPRPKDATDQGQLSAALADMCGLPEPVLLRQLEGTVEARTQEYLLAMPTSAAQVAASDSSRGGAATPPRSTGRSRLADRAPESRPSASRRR